MKQQIETPERRVLAPIFGVSRLRMATDGDGVTTLVTFVGCSLRCKWCLNNQSHQHIKDIPSAKLYSPRSLYHEEYILSDDRWRHLFRWWRTVASLQVYTSLSPTLQRTVENHR